MTSLDKFRAQKIALEKRESVAKEEALRIVKENLFRERMEMLATLVGLIEEGGLSIVSLSSKLNISRSTIYRWVEEYREYRSAGESWMEELESVTEEPEAELWSDPKPVPGGGWQLTHRDGDTWIFDKSAPEAWNKRTNKVYYSLEDWPEGSLEKFDKLESA